MSAEIQHVEYFLPERTLTAEDLAAEFPQWPAEKIQGKTGISTRHIVETATCASDLAVAAAEKLLAAKSFAREEIDYLLFCTQSPDYLLPTTACVLQDRLGLSNEVGALDFNLGCSGYIYGLGLAAGLIQTGQASLVLLLTGETYSKYLEADDKSTRTIFGDGAAATLIRSVSDDHSPKRSLYQYGTDGKGAPNLIVSAGGSRTTEPNSPPASGYLRMNGPEIFSFTMRVVPECISQILSKAGMTLAQIDLFIFHQANAFILEHLQRKVGIPPEKMFMWIEHCGNTVSSTIPIAIYEAQKQGKLRDGQHVMLLGFGVGYSWAATILRWPYLSYK